MVKPKIIEIDDILNGYNSSDKIREIYSRIIKEVLTRCPIQTSPAGLIIMEDTRRKGSYAYELYITEDYEVMIEAWGKWRGYAHESRWQPELSKAVLRQMDITIFKDNRKIEKSIVDIVSQFPRDSKKP